MAIPEQSSKGASVASKKRQYTISLSKYPSDLGAYDNPHYLEIQINVRGRSKFNKGNRLFRVNTDFDGAGLSDDELANAAKISAVAESGLVGAGIASKIFNLITKTGSSDNKSSFGSKLAGISGGAVGAAITYHSMNTNKLLKPDTKHRISDVINLYMPEPPTVKYKTNWANKDLGTLAGIISGSAFHDGIPKGLSESSAAIGTSLAKLPGIFGAIDVRDLLSGSTGTSLNPFKECIFESVDFRSFSFTYTFMPESEAESLEVQNIIKLLKFHMHPEMSEGKLFFVYPSEFQLAYYHRGKENSSFFKFAPCILSDLDVTYGDRVLSTFENGHSTEIIVKMTFHETEILTKESIEKGY